MVLPRYPAHIHPAFYFGEWWGWWHNKSHSIDYMWPTCLWARSGNRLTFIVGISHDDWIKFSLSLFVYLSLPSSLSLFLSFGTTKYHKLHRSYLSFPPFVSTSVSFLPLSCPFSLMCAPLRAKGHTTTLNNCTGGGTSLYLSTFIAVSSSLSLPPLSLFPLVTGNWLSAELLTFNHTG